MGKPLTEKDAWPLADYIVTLRPDWSRAGVLNQLEVAAGRGDAEAVTIAAIRAAYDPEATTPGAIPHAVGVDVPKGTQKPEKRGPVAGRTCGICGLGQDECRARWHWDHAFETIDQTRQKRVAAADAYLPRPPRNLAATYIDGKPVEDVELP